MCGGAGLFEEPENAEQGAGGCCSAPSTLQIGIDTPATSPGGC